jgi:inner membrane protein
MWLATFIDPAVPPDVRKSNCYERGPRYDGLVPTVFSHSLATLALGRCYPKREQPPRFWVLAALCAALPDVDVVGFGFGIRYGDLLGHRGLTHSLFFALVIGFTIAIVFFSSVRRFSKSWWALVVFFFIATASHGVLDAMTNGGLGVAFFSPFSNTRYFFSWRPIEVSPLGLDFISSGGIDVMISEFVWIWIPAGVIILAACILRRRFGNSR